MKEGKEKPQFTIKGFGELGQKLGRTPADETKELFDRLLAGKFDRLPDKISERGFKVDLAPITGFKFVPGKEKGTGVTGSLNVVIYYQGRPGSRDVERHVTWSIWKNGTISGEAPLEFKDLPREKINLEILRTLKKLHLDFWQPTEVPINIQADEGEPRPPPIKIDGGEGRSLRPEVLEFYPKQPGRLFGVFNKKFGFGKYELAFFRGKERDFIVMESQIRDNAAFLIDLAEGERIELPQDPELLTEEERDGVVGKYWSKIYGQAPTKRALREVLGAVRVVHHPGSWEVKMGEEIRKRTS